jgi:hypothetical protein
MPDTSAELGTQHMFWSFEETPVAERWKSRCRCRGSAMEGLEDADVEYIVYAGVLRQQ